MARPDLTMKHPSQSPKKEIFKEKFFFKALKRTKLLQFPGKTNCSSLFERMDISANHISFTVLKN